MRETRVALVRPSAFAKAQKGAILGRDGLSPQAFTAKNPTRATLTLIREKGDSPHPPLQAHPL